MIHVRTTVFPFLLLFLERSGDGDGEGEGGEWIDWIRVLSFTSLNLGYGGVAASAASGALVRWTAEDAEQRGVDGTRCGSLR